MGEEDCCTLQHGIWLCCDCRTKDLLLGGNTSAGVPSASVAAYDILNDKWDDTLAVIPEPLWGMALVPRGDTIYVFGGKTDKDFLMQVDSYNTTSNQWNTNVLKPLPRWRTGHVAATVNDITYLIGGEGNRGTILQQVDAWSWKDETWSVAQQLPVGRVFPDYTVLLDQIYIVGGQNATGHVTTRVDSFDTKTSTWSQEGTQLENARSGASALTLENTRLFVFGGKNSEGNAEESVELFDLMNRQWGAGGAMQRPWRWGMASATDGIRAFLIGGTDGTTVVNDHWSFFEEASPPPTYPPPPSNKNMPPGAVFAIVVVCIIPVVTLFLIFRRKICKPKEGALLAGNP